MKTPKNGTEIAKRGSKPFVRWWWFADRIEKRDISSQIRWISAQGFGGVEIAWIYPSKNSDSPEHFLSEGWADLVLHAYRECVENNLVCDLTFGTLWPFGGSFVPPEFASKTWKGLSSQRLTWSWESAYSDAPRFVIDHLKREAFEDYSRHMLAGFKPVLEYRNTLETAPPSAFFCDSLEVNPDGLWTDDFDERFAERYGYSLLPFMPGIDEDPHRRFEYRQMISELFIERFFRPYISMCSNNGMLSRVQAHGALTDILYAYSLCDIPESEALLFDPEFSLIPASASALAGKAVTSCETFTCIYGWVPYPERGPRMREEHVEDLKLVADALFASGINHIVWHGMPFNREAGNNEFYATVYVGRGGALEPHIASFNRYMEHISAVMQEGVPLTSLAVYLPVEDLQMLDRVPEEREKPSSAYYWEMHDIRWPAPLNGHHPTWVSAPFLEKASVDPFTGKIIIGEAVFDALFSNAEWMSFDALTSLSAIAESGGTVILDRIPKEPGTVHHREYTPTLERLRAHAFTREALKTAALRPMLSRKGENQELPLFRCRINEDSITCFIAHPDASGLTYPMAYGQALSAAECDLELFFDFDRWQRGDVSPDSEGSSYFLHFGAGESKLLSIAPGNQITELTLPQFRA